MHVGQSTNCMLVIPSHWYINCNSWEFDDNLCTSYLYTQVTTRLLPWWVCLYIYILYMVVWASIGLVVISSSLHIDYYSAAFDHECVVGCAARAVCTSVFEFSIGCFAYEDTHYKDCRGLLPLGLCWTAPWLANWHGSWTKRTKTWQNDTKRGCDSMWFYSVNAWYASTFGNTTVPILSPFLCLRLSQGWNLRSLLEPDWLFETNNHRSDLRCADVPITAEKSWTGYHWVTTEVVYGYLWLTWIKFFCFVRSYPFRRRWSLKSSKRESGATWAEVAGHEPELRVRRIAFLSWVAFGQTKWCCSIYACPWVRGPVLVCESVGPWLAFSRLANGRPQCMSRYGQIFVDALGDWRHYCNFIKYTATHTDCQPRKSYQHGEESLAGRSWHRFRKKAYRLIKWFRLIG